MDVERATKSDDLKFRIAVRGAIRKARKRRLAFRRRSRLFLLEPWATSLEDALFRRIDFARIPHKSLFDQTLNLLTSLQTVNIADLLPRRIMSQ